MTAANFSLEFQLSIPEIRKLNKMYFRHLFKERIVFCLFIILILVILVDYALEIDFFEWVIQSCLLIVLFVIIQFSFVDVISKGIFKLTKTLMNEEKFKNRYKLTFTYSNIYIRSPLGELTHKWSKIEKAISTKNFLFLYVKERNGYIISISKKDYDCKKIEELLSFVEKNIIQVIKI